MHAPGARSAAFAGVLDLLRVLEGIDLCTPGDPVPVDWAPSHREDGDD